MGGRKRGRGTWWPAILKGGGGGSMERRRGDMGAAMRQRETWGLARCSDGSGPKTAGASGTEHEIGEAGWLPGGPPTIVSGGGGLI
jgi:hypothetical protein